MKNVQRVGDPHLGRVFKNNVPLHRRGERERMVRAAFRQALEPAPGVENVVIMGDIFDKPQVTYETIWYAHGILADAASNHPKVMYWVIQGNHDESRDLNEITAWNIFELMLGAKPNIRLVRDALVVDDTVFLPWSPRYSAAEMLAIARPAIEESTTPVTKAYGHWDLDARSAHWNLIPLRDLAKLGITEIYTGHIHLPSVYEEAGVTVNVVGSLQPYAHGEDGLQSAEVRYITYNLSEYEELVELNLLDQLKNFCVRIRLDPSEAIPPPPDCLQWQVERYVEGDDEDAFGVELTLEGFELNKVYGETLDEVTIRPDVREKIDAKWNTIFSAPCSDIS